MSGDLRLGRLAGAGERGINVPEIVRPGEDIEVPLEPDKKGRPVVTLFGSDTTVYKEGFQERFGRDQANFRRFDLDPKHSSTKLLPSSLVSFQVRDGGKLGVRNLSTHPQKLLTHNPKDVPQPGDSDYDPKNPGWRRIALQPVSDSGAVAGKEEFIDLDTVHNGNVAIRFADVAGRRFTLEANGIKSEGDRNTALFRLIGPEN